jgi:hypothetical protein
MSESPTRPTQPATPPAAAADKAASGAPGEPLKAEVSRTESPGAGVSAAPQGTPADAAAPVPENPAAAQTAVTSEWSSAVDRPTAPADDAPKGGSRGA